MPSQNSYSHFLYRQLFTTPAPILPYDPSSSAHNTVRVPLTDKTAFITGSNTGLGYHAASQLLSLGLSHLILAVRNVAKGKAARERLLASLHRDEGKVVTKGTEPTIEVWEVDMASYASIIASTERIKREGTNIDYAILNAGVAKFAFAERDGRETTILTNWLGTALLSMTLQPILQAQFASRSGGSASIESPVLSIVGSEVAQWAKFNEAKVAAKKHTSVLTQLNDPKNFNMGDRYYTSKLLLMLFFVEFYARLPSDKDDVTINLVNPGFCYGSELHRSLDGVLGKVFSAMKRILGRSTEVGARTLVHAAVVAGRESHGRFLTDETVFPMADYVETEAGKEMGSRLWGEMKEELSAWIDVGGLGSGNVKA